MSKMCVGKTLIFIRFDGVVPNTPVPQHSASGSVKRKAPHHTPAVPKFNKTDVLSSPSDVRMGDGPASAQWVIAAEAHIPVNH